MHQIIHINGHGLYAPAINAESLVLDLGANIGRFSSEIRKRFGCIPVMVEANPDLARKLEETSDSRVINAAVAAGDGTAAFNISNNLEASSLLRLPDTSVYNATLERRVEVPAMALATLLRTLGNGPVDVLKMDIEGAEVAALQSVSDEVLSMIGQVTVEFHDDPSFGFGIAKQVDLTIDRLRSLGFASFQFNRPARTNALFVGPAIGLSAMEIARLRLRFDYLPAFFYASTRWLVRK